MGRFNRASGMSTQKRCWLRLHTLNTPLAVPVAAAPFWDYAPLLFNNPEINQKAGGIYE